MEIVERTVLWFDEVLHEVEAHELHKLGHALLAEQRVPFLEEGFGRPDEALAAGIRALGTIFTKLYEKGGRDLTAS